MSRLSAPTRRMGRQTLLLIVLSVAAMVLSTAVHEWAHAALANRLGDDTAKRDGRLTLSPVAHIDPFGTILMPVFGALMGTLVFGWGKPAPMDPVRFRRTISMRTGVILVSLAGPAANVVLAVLCAAILKGISLSMGTGVWEAGALRAFGMLLAVGLWLNVKLALFNLLPLAPLDGHRLIVNALRPDHPFVEFMERYRLVAMLLVLVVGGMLLAGPMLVLRGLIVATFSIGQEFALLWPG